jgi:hypothetical protein
MEQGERIQEKRKEEATSSLHGSQPGTCSVFHVAFPATITLHPEDYPPAKTSTTFFFSFSTA